MMAESVIFNFPSLINGTDGIYERRKCIDNF